MTAFKSVSHYQNAGKTLDYGLMNQLEANKRIPLDAACAALACQYPLNLASAWYGLSYVPQSVPIDVALPRYREGYRTELSRSAARKFMVKMCHPL